MGSITIQGIYEYDFTDSQIGPILLNRQSAALTALQTGRAATVKVANVTQRAAALAAHGTPSTSNPLIVFRANAGAGRELEYTTDGSTWRTIVTEDGTEWTPATVSPGFEEYVSGSGPEYKVTLGGVVSVRGAVRPANATAADAITTTSDQPIFTIPAAYHPVGDAAQYAASGLKQGSGSAQWHFRFTNGNFCASRYSGGNTGTGTWLPFSATYVI